VAPAPAEHLAEDHDDDEQDQQGQDRRGAGAPFRLLRDLEGLGRLGLGLVVRQGQLGDDRVGPRRDPAFQVAGLELRQDDGLDDDAGQGVGQDRLQAVADLDAHLAFGRSHDQQGAGVGPLLANAPGAAQLVAIVLDLVALQAGRRGHDQLAAGGLFQAFQLGRQLGLDLRRQDVGGVDDPAGQGGEGGGGRQGGEGEEQDKRRQ
jgi:hypothetical protein